MDCWLRPQSQAFLTHLLYMAWMPLQKTTDNHLSLVNSKRHDFYM